MQDTDFLQSQLFATALAGQAFPPVVSHLEMANIQDLTPSQACALNLELSMQLQFMIDHREASLDHLKRGLGSLDMLLEGIAIEMLKSGGYDLPIPFPLQPATIYLTPETPKDTAEDTMVASPEDDEDYEPSAEEIAMATPTLTTAPLSSTDEDKVSKSTSPAAQATTTTTTANNKAQSRSKATRNRRTLANKTEEHVVRNREAQRRFRERQRTTITDLEGQVEAKLAELATAQAEKDASHRRNAIMEGLLRYKNEQVAVMEAGKATQAQIAVPSTVAVDEALLEVINKHTMPGAFTLDKLLRYSPAGVEGHLGPHGLAEEAPALETVVSDYTELGKTFIIFIRFKTLH